MQRDKFHSILTELIRLLDLDQELHRLFPEKGRGLDDFSGTGVGFQAVSEQQRRLDTEFLYHHSLETEHRQPESTPVNMWKYSRTKPSGALQAQSVATGKTNVELGRQLPLLRFHQSLYMSNVRRAVDDGS